CVGYSGTGYRGFQNPPGNYIEWTTYAPFAGTQPLQFRYANGGAIKSMELKLNGVVLASSLSFPATGGWTNWMTVASTARLNPGTNTIRLTTTSSSGPNIDYLVLGSGSNAAPGLALRFAFDDPAGTTTTLSDTNQGGANVTLQMLNTNNLATDYHGAPGS